MKKNILLVTLGFILAIGCVVIADNLNASEIDYNDTTVESALNTLYQRSTYTEYSGSTTVTPSTTAQTLETNNKLLKSNITINAVPTFTPAASYTPSDTQQTISTKDKMLTDDIVINAIPSSYQDTIDSQAETISELQSQLNNISTAATYLSFTSKTTTQTFNIGFKPDFISCLILPVSSGGAYTLLYYNYNYDSSHAYRISSSSSASSVNATSLSSNVQTSVSTYFTINNNGFIWNTTSTNSNGRQVYCTASK